MVKIEPGVQTVRGAAWPHNPPDCVRKGILSGGLCGHYAGLDQAAYPPCR